MLTVRVGCNIHFECESSATVILLVNPRFDPERPIRQEKLDFGRATKSESFVDADGNVAYRVVLAPGLNKIQHDGFLGCHKGEKSLLFILTEHAMSYDNCEDSSHF